MSVCILLMVPEGFIREDIHLSICDQKLTSSEESAVKQFNTGKLCCSQAEASSASNFTRVLRKYLLNMHDANKIIMLTGQQEYKLP